MPVDLRQTHFRFGKDDGTESGHTFWQLEDVNHTQLITADWTFLLRFTEQEVGGTAAGNVAVAFQYNKNGAGWVNITTTSSVVRAVAVGAFTNGDHCTKRLSGTGTFEVSAQGCTEDGTSGGNQNDIVASGNSETEAGLQVVFANVANNDTIQLRIWWSGTLTYDVTPILTISIVTTQELTAIPVAVASSIQVGVASGSGIANLTGIAKAVASSVVVALIAGSGIAPLAGSPVAVNSSIANSLVENVGGIQELLASPVVADSSIVAGVLAGSGIAPLSGVAVPVSSSIQNSVIAGSGVANMPSSPVAVNSSIQQGIVAGSGVTNLPASPLAVASSVVTGTVENVGGLQNLNAVPVVVVSSVPQASVSGSGFVELLASPVISDSLISLAVLSATGYAELLSSPVLVE